jgi:ArsR family transcriptional regulator, arsenate/arsenite/antimonite-responsive transcriptional repressor
MSITDAFTALSDPTRRQILRMLRDKPMTSGDIASQFNHSWATVSRHLNVLKGARLVLTEKNGQHIWYELNTTVLQDVIEHMLEWSNKGDNHA